MGERVEESTHQSRVPRPLSCMTQVGNWLKLAVVPALGAWAIRALGRTLFLRTVGAEQVDALYRRGGRMIIVFWHGRQLMMPLAYRGTEAHVLVSRHRDGELISRLIGRFGFRSVRGSTTRGGVEALRQLIRLGRTGMDLVVTPDGPRGPRQVVQKGVVQLAKATGLPIVPLTFGCSKKNSLRVGIAFCCPIPSAGRSSCGGRRFGFRPTRMTRRSRPSGWKSRRRSIA
ncbi:lysophospholipid acyltransferase family protein [Nitrospira sp. Kam-Ns4a]